MVWNQYVYEAMNGSEAYNSENEDENNIEEPLHITDWELIYQEELRYMWANIQQYLYDSSFSSRILNYANYDDFVSFCFEMSKE
jgi:hypothetical protein|tara:strand:- start:6977 stop:7228 length:252 start_codon:yes stop_codon:yes gene_type:complete